MGNLLGGENMQMLAVGLRRVMQSPFLLISRRKRLRGASRCSFAPRYGIADRRFPKGGQGQPISGLIDTKKTGRR